MAPQAFQPAGDRQRQVRSQFKCRCDNGKAVARADIGVDELNAVSLPNDAGQSASHRQLSEIDVGAGNRVRARLVAEQPDIAGQQHRRVGGEHARALRLSIDEPVRARLVRAWISRVLDQDDDGMRMVIDWAQLPSRTFQHVSVDHIDAGRERLGLAFLQLGDETGNSGIADRIGEQRCGR